MKRISRRQFITYLVAAGGAVILGKAAFASPKADTTVDTHTSNLSAKKTGTGKQTRDGFSTGKTVGFRPAMVIDAGACIGCRQCMYGCKAENNTPDSISPPWIELFQMSNDVDLTGHPSEEDLKSGATTNYTISPREGYWYLAAQCNHCDNAPCVKVCPTGATYRDTDGYVLMDYNKCVGCRFCVVACPYNARRFNWVKGQLKESDVNPLVPVRPVGVVEKCTFCVHRTRDGKQPRCVEVCPVKARHFGDINDPESEVSRLLHEEKSIRLLEELNTQPHIWYITRGKKYLG